jgi:hypothetical protein
MTVRQRIELQLIGFGLWPDQAKQVVDLFIADPKKPVIQWDQPEEFYPLALLASLLIDLRATALTWVMENHPEQIVAIELLTPATIEVRTHF